MIRQLLSMELARPGAVQRLEDALMQMPQADIRTAHKFLPGLYERTITIPPWTVLTGAPHKTAYVVRLEKGTIAVNTDDGVRVLTAPCEFPAPAGVKRVGRVFGDEVVWTDIYQNADNCTDLPTLENRLYEVPACGLGENRCKICANEEAVIDYLGSMRVNFGIHIQGEIPWQVG